MSLQQRPLTAYFHRPSVQHGERKVLGVICTPTEESNETGKTKLQRDPLPISSALGTSSEQAIAHPVHSSPTTALEVCEAVSSMIPSERAKQNDESKGPNCEEPLAKKTPIAKHMSKKATKAQRQKSTKGSSSSEKQRDSSESSSSTKHEDGPLDTPIMETNVSSQNERSYRVETRFPLGEKAIYLNRAPSPVKPKKSMSGIAPSIGARSSNISPTASYQSNMKTSDLLPSSPTMPSTHVGASKKEDTSQATMKVTLQESDDLQTKSTKSSSKETRELKQAAATQDTIEHLPRISAKLSLANLKEEALCRGLDLKRLPRTKADLLSLLVDGSIHLRESQAWKEVEKLRGLIQREEQDREKWRRENEIESQKTLHVNQFPLIHSHPLASTMLLTRNGKARIPSCDTCGRNQPMAWTCERCDFDICRLCFNDKIALSGDKIVERHEEEGDIICFPLHHSECSKLDEKKRKEPKQKSLDRASKKFDQAIIQPSAKNIDLNGSRQKGFTVWCLFQERGEDRSLIQFDSTWSNAREANDRARFLFFWHNPWGKDPDDVLADEEFEKGGLKNLSGRCGDGGWSVGVVPDVAFLHFPNTSSARHCFP